MTGVLERRARGGTPRHHPAPRPRPDARIGHRERVLDGVRAAPGEALDDAAVRARPQVVGLRVEVARLDDQRVAFPVAARHPQPLPHPSGERGLLEDGNDAEVVDLLLEDGDVAGRLQDVDVVVVAARRDRHMAVDEAAVAQIHVLRPVRRHPPPLGRGQPLRFGSRLVLPAFRRPGRQPPVLRIGDQRRAADRDAAIPPELVVGQGHVLLPGQLAPPFGGRPGLGCEVGRRDLLVREPLAAGVLRGSFQRCDGAVVPQPLQIGIPPGCPGRRRRLVGRHALGRNRLRVSACHHRQHGERENMASHFGHPPGSTGIAPALA